MGFKIRIGTSPLVGDNTADATVTLISWDLVLSKSQAPEAVGSLVFAITSVLVKAGRCSVC